MTDIEQAARDLNSHFGRPDWLVAIGIGKAPDGTDAIFVYTKGSRTRYYLPEIKDGWQGHKVIVRKNAAIAPIGGN